MPEETRLEQRSAPGRIEFRAAADGSGSPGTLEGYAAVFNSESRDLGGWVEVIDPTAFGPVGDLDMERHTRVMARSEHDSRNLLGTTDAGTLSVSIDDTGLRYVVTLPDTAAGRDAAVLAQRGDYRFSSFAFYTLPGGSEWRENPQGILVRRVTAALLVDVAPVADPAYWGSSVGVREFDLDAIRASIHPSPTPPGDWERSARDRALDIEARISGGKKGI